MARPGSALTSTPVLVPGHHADHVQATKQAQRERATRAAVGGAPTHGMHVQGECATLPPSVAAGLPPGASIPDGACVIRVLHAWLEVVVAAAAREAGDHALWVSGFVVQAARPAADQQEAPLLTVVGTNAWLANMLFIGDGFYGRGVRVSSGEVYVGGVPAMHVSSMHAHGFARLRCRESAEWRFQLRRCGASAGEQRRCSSWPRSAQDPAWSHMRRIHA